MIQEQETVRSEPDAQDGHRRAYAYLSMAWNSLEEAKPKDRSERDREFQIIMTEIEKVKAMLKGMLIYG
jgi:hypothetical protein